MLLKNDNEGNCVEASGTAYCGTGDTDPAYEPVVSLPVVEQDVVFTPGNRTLGKRVEYFELPTESFQPVIDWGNESVASRAGSIQQEQVIRSSDWSVYLWQPIGLKVRCAHVAGYTGLKAWWGNATFEKPIRVVFRGKSAAFDLNSPAPGQGVYFDPSLPNGQLADEVRVEPYLLIVDDFDDGASNDCKLNLSGTFKTNGETVVFYHIVDDRGEMSPLYKVAVDQTYTAFVYHPVDLSEREPEAPQPGINRGFSAIPTDRLQGFYEIRVVSPYKTVSNVASFNLEPCKTRPDTIHSILGG